MLTEELFTGTFVIMIIDSHQHVFWHGRNDTGLVADLDEYGIDKAWLLTWENPPAEDTKLYRHALNPVHLRPDGSHPGIPLEDILAAYNKYPDRFVPGYCPDPNLDDAAKWFEDAVKIHGIRICGEWKFRMLLDNPHCLELFRKAGELGCPVVAHFDAPYIKDKKSGQQTYYPLWYGGTMDNFSRTLSACPDMIFLGHGPGFWREISGQSDENPKTCPDGPVKSGGRLYDLLETYPNLYVDLSAGSGLNALKRDPQHAKTFLNHYADRIMFARDYYGGELLEFIQKMNLPQEVNNKILCTNAQRIVWL